MLPMHYYNARGSQSVAHDIRALATIIMYAQQCALSSYSQQEIRCDIEHHTYQCQDRTIGLSHGVRFGTLPGTQGPPSHPTKAITTPITFENHTLILYPNGTVSSGTVYLTDGTCMYAVNCACWLCRVYAHIPI